MRLPSLPGAISGVRDRFRSRGSSAAGTAERGGPAPGENPGMPMPLALQGVIELLVVAVVGLLLSAVLLGAVWAAGGFATLGAAGTFRLAGQVWLLAHCTPISIESVQGLSLDGAGTLTLVPLGLTLLPFGLAVVAGRRIARACWRGQFLVPFAAGMVGYGVFAALVALLSRTDQVKVDLLPAALLPLIPAGLGTLVGGWSVSRSLAAVLGADVASWLERTSQYSRWAGSYVWAVIRAGFLAAVAAVGAGALLFAVTLLWHWDRVITVYQDLGADAAGDTALTALQLGYLPNMVLWALAWATGAGFSLGTGAVTSPFQSVLGPLPQFPALAALPTGDPWGIAPAVLVLPVLAGVLAGWWFCREGENHLDDWMAIRLPLRWITFLLSTLLTVAFIAAVGAGLVSGLAWLSNGSLGIGRLTDMGPHAWQVFLWLGAELAVGAAVGYLLGPWLEREGYRSRSWSAEDEDTDDDAAAAPSRHTAPVREHSDPAAREHTVAPADRATVEDRRPPYDDGSRGRPRVPSVLSAGREDVEPQRGSSALGTGSAVRDAVAPEAGASSRGAVSSSPGSGSSAVCAGAAVPRSQRAATTRGAAAPSDETPDRASQRVEAKRRRAEKKSAKRKAARLAALDEDETR
ncbi:hypothetical protein KVA01_05330 [Kocuria varians]|uniref:Integral membrane protein n=1 Tax=Kocuria varians TaxID=1272 RepID=A0A4Y4CZK4_KOCVA|nr:DUF6350 family protein [Kocuria varians]GEC98378.1 hypothetical protein KVA01_05330 [Kocuria varians]